MCRYCQVKQAEDDQFPDWEVVSKDQKADIATSKEWHANGECPDPFVPAQFVREPFANLFREPFANLCPCCPPGDAFCNFLGASTIRMIVKGAKEFKAFALDEDDDDYIKQLKEVKHNNKEVFDQKRAVRAQKSRRVSTQHTLIRSFACARRAGFSWSPRRRSATF